MTTEWDRIQHELVGGMEDLFNEFMETYNGFIEKNQHWTSFVTDAKNRYQTGRAQHHADGTSWDTWNDDEFDMNIREEFIDYVIYAAARRLARIKGAAAA